MKFTPEGGKIQVYLYQRPSERGENYVQIHFRVKDNGIGMSPEFQKKLFESFAREDSARVQKIEGLVWEWLLLSILWTRCRQRRGGQ